MSRNATRSRSRSIVRRRVRSPAGDRRSRADIRARTGSGDASDAQALAGAPTDRILRSARSVAYDPRSGSAVMPLADEDRVRAGEKAERLLGEGQLEQRLDLFEPPVVARFGRAAVLSMTEACLR